MENSMSWCPHFSHQWSPVVNKRDFFLYLNILKKKKNDTFCAKRSQHDSGGRCWCHVSSCPSGGSVCRAFMTSFACHCCVRRFPLKLPDGMFWRQKYNIYLLANVNAECFNILGNVFNTIHIRPQPQQEVFITEPCRSWWVDFLTTEHVQVQRPCFPCFRVLDWAQSGYWSPRLTPGEKVCECGTSSLASRGSGGESHCFSSWLLTAQVAPGLLYSQTRLSPLYECSYDYVLLKVQLVTCISSLSLYSDRSMWNR